MLDKLFRPIYWERSKDFRVTQQYWANFKVDWKWMYWEIVKWWTKHEGIDYAWPNPWDSIPVYSSHKWVVRALNDKNWFGNYVVIDEVWYSTYYAHLASVSVKSWEFVKANTQLGMMWSSGNSTAVHLHFGLKINWERVDPTPYIINWDYSPSVPTIDPDIQALIDWWIFNWNYEPMDYKRLIKMMWKLYVKLK